MSYLLVRHKVENYAKWKAIFDEHSATRKANGSKGGRLFRSATNPNKMVVLFEWDSLDKAQKFAQSPDLREGMQRAGVVGQPDLYFIDEVERLSA